MSRRYTERSPRRYAEFRMPLRPFKLARRGLKPCGARNRTNGKPCMAAGLPHTGRCGWHGGKSSGAKTSEGIERLREAGRKGGRRSGEVRRAKRDARLLAAYTKTPLPDPAD